MAQQQFPWAHMHEGEYVIVDTNPNFSQLLWPLLEVLALTGVIWLIIGLMDHSVFAGPAEAMAADPTAGGSPLRTGLIALWLILAAWRAAKPTAEWLSHRLVVTNFQIILRQGVFRRHCTIYDLRSIGNVEKQKKSVVLTVYPYGVPIAIDGIPKPRKVAKAIRQAIQQL